MGTVKFVLCYLSVKTVLHTEYFLLPGCSPQSGRKCCCCTGSESAARSAVFSLANKHPLCVQRHCLHLRRKVASHTGVILHSFQSEAKWKLTPIFIAPVVWIPDTFQQTITSITVPESGRGKKDMNLGKGAKLPRIHKFGIF